MDKNKQTIHKVTTVALVLNTALAIFKVVGGWIGGSHAVIADGFHSFSDCITDVMIIFGVRLWTKPPDKQHPYGHQKIESIISVTIGLILFGTALALLWHSLATIRAASPKSPEIAAIIVAFASIVAKEMLFRYTRRKGEAINSEALKANALHQRSDAFSSIPVAVSVIAAAISPQLYFMDQLAAICVSCCIGYGAYKIVKPGLSRLLDASIDQGKISQIQQLVLNDTEVHDIGSLRARWLGNHISVELTVKVSGELTVAHSHKISVNIEKRLLIAMPQIIEVLIHVKPQSPGSGLPVK